MSYFIALFFSFKGRITRTEYWLANILIAAGVIIIGKLCENRLSEIVVFILCAPFFWAYFTVLVKRLHDRNKTAMWLFLMLIPFLGWTWLYIELGFMPAKVPNRYLYINSEAENTQVWKQVGMVALILGGFILKKLADEKMKQGAQKKYMCRYCGQSYDSLSALTLAHCHRHPFDYQRGRHALYEGVAKQQYECKHCGKAHRTIAELTHQKCFRHPSGSDTARHEPSL